VQQEQNFLSQNEEDPLYKKYLEQIQINQSQEQVEVKKEDQFDDILCTKCGVTIVNKHKQFKTKNDEEVFCLVN
jgi:hypothetical protein